MKRQISLLGAVTNLGLKPYDDGRARQLHEAPRVLRELGLVERLGASDRGDVVAEPYRDFIRPATRVRNDDEIVWHSEQLAGAVDAATTNDEFLLLLGGDCSVLLGGLHGFRRRGPCGLAFVDGHSDFATVPTSESGAAAGMDLALAVGRGDSPLARLRSDGPLVREEDAFVLGRRDPVEDVHFGADAVTHTRIGDIGCDEVRRDPAAAAAAALARVAAQRFYIHLDVDVLDSTFMPAVDSPQDGGLTADELVTLLRPLVHHPNALGLEVTIYDPGLDPERVCGGRVVEILGRVFE